jgi:hypothetical protein
MIVQLQFAQHFKIKITSPVLVTAQHGQNTGPDQTPMHWLYVMQALLVLFISWNSDQSFTHHLHYITARTNQSELKSQLMRSWTCIGKVVTLGVSSWLAEL